jgi:hypothetical protein
MRPGYCHVEVRAFGIQPDDDVFWCRGGDWFVAEQGDMVFTSALTDTGDINAHLKWLFMVLEFERKKMKQLQDQGVRVVVRVSCTNLPIRIEPDSLLLMHKLHLPVEIVKATRPAV